MTRIINIDCRVGDIVVAAPSGRIHTNTPAALNEYMEPFLGSAAYTPPEVVTIAKLKVVAVLPMKVIPVPGKPAFDYVPVKSLGIARYKAMRHTGFPEGAVALLKEDGDEVVRVVWPESKPFHDAFGAVDENTGTRQVLYCTAIEVDGNYRLQEILEDQEW